MEEGKIKLGKITVYGTVIDLDNTPIEELDRMGNMLENRLIEIGKQYVEIGEKIEALKKIKNEG